LAAVPFGEQAGQVLALAVARGHPPEEAEERLPAAGGDQPGRQEHGRHQRQQQRLDGDQGGHHPEDPDGRTGQAGDAVDQVQGLVGAGADALEAVVEGRGVERHP
jgi:hypothetical protein